MLFIVTTCTTTWREVYRQEWYCDTSTANCGPHSNSRVSYSLRDQSISHLYVTLLYFQPPPPLFFYINLLDPLPYHPSTLHLGINSSPRKSSYSDTSTSFDYTAHHQNKEGTMPTFSSRPHAPSESAKTFQQILRTLRKRPFLLFGAPFLSLMVVSSFALQNLTKTRYDYQSSKTSTMTMEEGLGMNKDRKRVDIREEYFVSRLDSPKVWFSCRSGAGRSDWGVCSPLQLVAPLTHTALRQSKLITRD